MKQQRQIVEVGLAAIGPVDEVVTIAPHGA
jgi:hypothetical protein